MLPTRPSETAKGEKHYAQPAFKNFCSVFYKKWKSIKVFILLFTKSRQKADMENSKNLIVIMKWTVNFHVFPRQFYKTLKIPKTEKNPLVLGKNRGIFAIFDCERGNKKSTWNKLFYVPICTVWYHYLRKVSSKIRQIIKLCQFIHSLYALSPNGRGQSDGKRRFQSIVSS